MMHEPVSISYQPAAADSIKALLDQHGYVYVEGFPEGFDYPGFCAPFGPLVPQYNGDLICSITPDEQYEHLDHPLTTNPLPPHTDGYEYEGAPPRYLALWCLTPPSDGGGRTTLCDMLAFADKLSDAERGQLNTRRYRFVSGIEETPTERSALHPILEESSGQLSIFRFSHEFTQPRDDPFLSAMNERILDYFDRHHSAIAYEPGSLLIWDNFRMVHGRTGFEDKKRHLRRIWLRGS